MSPTISYSLFAAGLPSVDGAPVPGFLVGNQAIFGLDSSGYDALPPLRRWIRRQGGTVLDETGTPAPELSLDDNRLYAVSLGPSESIRVTGIARAQESCAECRLPMSRMLLTGDDTVAEPGPSRPLISTSSASWLATAELVAALGAPDGLDRGLAETPVDTPAGPCTACWPDRLLPSRWSTGMATALRCSTCLRIVDSSGASPREWVPRYSLGLLVDAPEDRSGWWWHARFGQHLPILSGDVVRHLQGVTAGVSALPVHLDEAEAFLPEEYR